MQHIGMSDIKIIRSLLDSISESAGRVGAEINTSVKHDAYSNLL